MGEIKKYVMAAIQLAIGLAILGVFLDLVLAFTGVSARKYIFSPLTALGIVKPPAATPSTTAPAAGS